MYKSFFGLTESPFTLTPNTHFYLNSETHKRGLELLLVALENKEGFIKITGEVGTGKTLLCRMLLNSLGDGYNTAYIPNPILSPESLYLAIAEELGMELDSGQGSHQILKQINSGLIDMASRSQQVVLVIDEAQSMPEETIEALRLLTNLETESDKLLQVVLFGQPELDQMLAKESMRQLLQRITFSHKIDPLDTDSVERYVTHRMTLAGYNGPALYDRRALRLLAKASGGIPRLINVLSHKALMSAYGQGDRLIRKKHVKNAIHDTESVAMPRFQWWPV